VDHAERLLQRPQRAGLRRIGGGAVGRRGFERVAQALERDARLVQRRGRGLEECRGQGLARHASRAHQCRPRQGGGFGARTERRLERLARAPHRAQDAGDALLAAAPRRASAAVVHVAAPGVEQVGTHQSDRERLVAQALREIRDAHLELARGADRAPQVAQPVARAAAWLRLERVAPQVEDRDQAAHPDAQVVDRVIVGVGPDARGGGGEGVGATSDLGSHPGPERRARAGRRAAVGVHARLAWPSTRGAPDSSKALTRSDTYSAISVAGRVASMVSNWYSRESASSSPMTRRW